MATTQRPKHPAQRMTSGNNILSRMLQMEKQSKHQRASSISPVLPPAPKADYFSESVSSPASSPNLPSPVPHFPLRPSQVSRSQTSPVLHTALQSTEKPPPVAKTMPLTVDTDVAPEEKPSEICLSPSWSDHGEKARKKEKRKAEREQKEREKRLRQDEERQKAMDVKAGKRLSKKQPPAAMETQKMPTSIRRNSWKSFMSAQPSSGENSRRSSRDEKRLSGRSFGSSRRSQSMPGTSTESAPDTAGASEPWKPIVSASAPKLPSFRFSSSRKVPPAQAKSGSPGKDACEKDLIAFAYRLETSGIINESEKIDGKTPKKISPAEMLSKPAAPSQNTLEPSFKSVPYETVSKESPQPTPIGRNGKPDSKILNGHDRSRSGQASPGLPTNGSLPSPLVKAQSPTKPGHDGSSYVHKQRMYQQQQSIADFEDQQAIKDATEAASRLAAEREVLAQVPKSAPEPVESAQSSKTAATHGKATSVSSVYTKQRDRSSTPPSPRLESAQTKQQPVHPASLSLVAKPLPETPAEKHQAALQSAEKTMNLTNDQVTANHKKDRILGFRRRTKQSPALTSTPYNAENQVVAVQSAPPDINPSEEPGVKRSKIERLFREPKPALANKDRRSSSSSSKDRAKDPAPEVKPKQSHSRTRTASSSALNGDIAWPLPKSKTESALTKAKKHVETASGIQNDHSDQKKSKDSSQNSPQKLHTRQSSAVIESDPKSKPKPEAKPPAKDVASEKSAPNDDRKTKTDKKQAHEIIVESETGEGLIRKTSIKRPRSNPQIQKPAAAAADTQALDFLPPLKHQPLVKRERHSPTRTTSTDNSPVSISQFQEPITSLGYESPNAPDLKLIPRSPFRPPSAFPLPIPTANRFNRSATEVSKSSSFGKGPPLTSGVESKPLAKLFVICCKCKFWHDLPSKLYEAMALPLELHKAEKGKMAGARLETAVKCPWCEHAMTTGCCQGWTTVVYMHERHH